MTMLDELLAEMKRRCWPEPTLRSQCAEICYWYDPAGKQRSLMCQLDGGWIYVVGDFQDVDRNEMRIVETVGQAARFLDVFRQRLKPGEIPCLDPVFVKLFGNAVPQRFREAGRPVCVPPMESKSDCQNDGPAPPAPMIDQRQFISSFDWSEPESATPPEGEVECDGEPEPLQAPPTDAERLAAIRCDLDGVPDDGPDCSDEADMVFLLGQIDKLLAKYEPPKPEPNDWVAQLGRPYQPPI